MNLNKKTGGLIWLCAAAALALALTGALPNTASAEKASLAGYAKGQGWRYVELGTYPQTLEGGLEPIVWRVLSAEGGKAYLVSEYVLLNRRIHPDDSEYMLANGSFEATEMYDFLNGTFLESFTEDERAMLETDGSGGCVTLLSADDLRNPAYGFGSYASRVAYGTPYALQNGLYQYSRAYGNASPYWTCTQNPKALYGAYCTKAAGNLGYIRVVVQNEGCRPACTLKLITLQIKSGDGTLKDPYRLSLLEGRVEP